MMFGGSLELKDSKVDNILIGKGIHNAEIYYSPIKSWLVQLMILVFIIIPTIGLFYQYISIAGMMILGLIISSYLIFFYIIIGLTNKHFALTNRELLVVSTHFPFKNLDRFRFDDILSVKISSDKKKNILFKIGLLGGNYIEFETKKDRRKFYCLFLDVDCYDENWTKRTLDDLAFGLKSRNVKTELEI